ncbi:MAG: chromosome partitioning protein ParB [Chloroflexi bacterium]|nr:chromosome partitioning protein ParB [Chloroflexota bacterium]
MSKSNRIATNKDVFSGLKVKSRVVDEGESLEEARLLPTERVEPNPEQPRKRVNPEKDAELTADIGERGILQPIIVRPHPSGAAGQFQIIAGERRWRAAREAGLEEVPVLIKEVDDQEAQLVSLVENLQRLDLEQEDEAEFFRKLSNDYNLSNRQIARMINRSHGYVNERLRQGPPEPEIAAKPDKKGDLPASNTATVRERLATQTQNWRFRPQNFQRFRSYISETLENWEQVDNEQSRQTLIEEVANLKDELARLEKKLHVKTLK